MRSSGIASIFVGLQIFGQPVLDDAYAALRQGKLTAATEQFAAGLAAHPRHHNARLDYAATLVRVGEPMLARRELEIVLQAEPDNWAAALEYAFLCHETGLRREARQEFARVQALAPAPARKTAEAAHRRIEQELNASIQRWTEALRLRPNADTVHEELARLHMEAGAFEQSALHYAAAYKLNPLKTHLLLEAGRAKRLAGDPAGADRHFRSGLLSADVRTADQARTLLGWDATVTAKARFRPRAMLPRHLTFWTMPLYSSRWKSAFAYGQTKFEWRQTHSRWRPYLSLRWAGDLQGRPAPAPLSERALTPAVGLSARPARGVQAFVEAGANFGNTRGRDLRGGIQHTWNRPFSEHLSLRVESAANYSSRFSNNTLFSLRPEAVYAISFIEVAGLIGVCTDTRREYWGNFMEAGVAVRLRVPFLPGHFRPGVEIVRGRNYVARGNPQAALYTDIRIGGWYAFSH